VISREDVRHLLLDRRLFAAVSDEVGDDTELHFDSVSVLWFLQGISERFGMDVTLEEGDIEHFTSVGRITAWLEERLGRTGTTS
jgi:acyl carrier protein